MEIRVLKLEEMSDELFNRFAAIERGLRKQCASRENLERELTGCTVFGCFDSEVLVAFLAVQPNSRFFGSSVYLRRICYDWQHNDEKTISALIVTVTERFNDSMLVMEIHRQREMNRELYIKLGFTDTIMKSPRGKDYVVLIASARRILMQSEKSGIDY